MSNCLNYDCDDVLTTYLENDCGYNVPGGSNQAVLFECNATTYDYTNGVQILADIAAGRAIKITRCSFDIPAPSPQKITSKVPCEGSSVISYDRTINYYNPNVSPVNSTLHNAMFKGHKFAAILLYECAANAADIAQCTLINDTVKFSGGRILPGNTKEEQRYEGVGEWESLEDPSIIATPTGVFL